ncbi:phosphodiesterase [uncultured Roseibium sp.]|uniref:phosphodiesterase n=1 Tax=uncultured Roseibium sp. TaxID=1936171 RepID=UPI00321807E1
MLIVHLSDLHLRVAGQLYQGLVDSNALFDLALDTLLDLTPAPDLVIIGGDLVDEGTEAEYATVRKALARLPKPVLAIPGNHDDRENFRRCLGERLLSLPRTGPLHQDTGHRWPVRVIALDVTVPGAHHGEITDETLDWLGARLREAPGHPTLLLMHQPPVESGMGFIDAYRCEGGDRLARLLTGFDNIERVLCGHIHRPMQARFGGSLLMTAPSTATSIALRLEREAEPASFLEPPAFLLHHLRPGQALTSHWVPVGRFPGPLPFF